MVKIDESLYIGGALCRLKEVMYGEMSNMLNGQYDYELAEKHNPNTERFSLDDLLHCGGIKELPPDWKAFAYDCIEKYKLY